MSTMRGSVLVLVIMLVLFVGLLIVAVAGIIYSTSHVEVKLQRIITEDLQACVSQTLGNLSNMSSDQLLDITLTATQTYDCTAPSGHSVSVSYRILKWRSDRYLNTKPTDVSMGPSAVIVLITAEEDNLKATSYAHILLGVTDGSDYLLTSTPHPVFIIRYGEERTE
jgi:hypothetical protein